MIRSVLIGIVAGMRSLTPIAVISWLSSPRASKVAVAMAAAELLGDKLPFAPDRIVTAGILARVATGAFAGMAVAPRREQYLGAVLGATAAVVAAYASFGLRQRAMRRGGQTATGLIEDALALAAAVLVTRPRR